MNNKIKEKRRKKKKNLKLNLKNVKGFFCILLFINI